MIRFITANLVDQAISLSPSTVNLQFPVENIRHPFRTKVFRSNTNADSIILDFGETSDIDTIGIVDVPRVGFGISTITLELSATANFTTPAFSQVITLDQQFGIGFSEFSLQQYRFARLVMTSTLGYCELSNVFIGKRTEFEEGTGINLGWSYLNKDNSVVKENSYGQRFADRKNRQRQISFSLTALNPLELDQVTEIHDTKGTIEPLFILLGNDEMSTNPNRYSGMFYLNSIPSITNIAFGLYDMSMSFEEAM